MSMPMPRAPYFCAAAIGIRRPASRGAKVEGRARVDERDSNSVRSSGESQFDLIGTRQAAMLVKICNEFLDDNAQPGSIVLG